MAHKMRPAQQEAGKALTSHANHHHVHLREPLKKLNRLRRQWFCGSQAEAADGGQKAAGRRRAQEPNCEAANQPSRLIRMIADKNAPKRAGARWNELAGAGEMLILLGSAQCPRDAESDSISRRMRMNPVGGANQQPMEDKQTVRLSRRPSKSLLASRSSTSDNSNSNKQPLGALNADRMGQLIELLNEFSKQTELRTEKQQQQQQQSDSFNPEAASKRLSRSLSSSSSSSFTSSQSRSARSSSKRLDLSSVASNQAKRSASEEELLHLEDNWTDFVRLPTSTCQLDEQQQQSLNGANVRVQQDAIWELLTSEVFYIKRLKVIIELFLTTLLRLQSSHALLIEVDAKQLFSNISEILEANRTLFWAAHLLPMLERSRASGKPLKPALMRNAFVQMRAIFSPYYKYCLEHTTCLSYFKAQSNSNECFKLFVAWCESQKDCERLRLTDLLAKPMQRLTRYSLLLKAILKRSELAEERLDLELMILETNKFVLTVDLELRRKEELELLAATKRRIDSYDIQADVYSDEVERLLRSYCRFELAAPLFRCASNCHRQLLLDSHAQLGQVRFKDAHTGGKLEVELLVFTDHLFVCKQTGSQAHRQSQVQSAAQVAHLSPRANSPGAAANQQQQEIGWPESDGQQPALDSARDLFVARSSDANRCPEEAHRLRVIRAPYPIERLVVHELKDGQTLLVCQLNDSNTIASSFVLYLEAKRPEESCESAPKGHLRSQNQSVESADSGASGAVAPQPPPLSPAGARRRSSDARWRCGAMAPARQLAALIRQAQLRYQAAAAFHGLRLASFEASRELGGSLESKSSRLSTWSSFRHHSRAKSPSGGALLRLEAATTSGREEPRQWLALNRRSASSETNQLEPATGELIRQQPQVKAVLEQQQSMLLNHGLHDQLLAFEFQSGGPAAAAISKTTCSRAGSQSSVFEEQAACLAKQATNKQRRHNLGRSARVATNPELSSDNDDGQQAPNCATTSSSSSTTTRSSSPRLTNHFLQRAQQVSQRAEQAPSALGQRASGRKNLSSLRRQNVILSVSSEQQPVAASDARSPNSQQADESSSVSVSAPPGASQSWLKQRQLARELWSQATTADQTSAAFDEAEQAEFAQSPTGADSARATSFELGNLRKGALQTASGGLSAQPVGARSASMETRSSVSVTLTLPANELHPQARPPPAQSADARRPDSAVYLRIPSKQQQQARRHNFAASSAPMLLDLSANGQVEPERSKSSDDSSSKSSARQASSNGLSMQPMFKLSLQSSSRASNESLEADRKSSGSTARSFDKLPMVEVINASPQALHSSCQFPAASDSQEQDLSSLEEDPLGANQRLSCSADSASHSAQFLKRCQTFLHFRRSPRKLSAHLARRLEASKRSLEGPTESQAKSNGIRLRLALSDDASAAAELDRMDEPLMDMNCIGNLVQLKASSNSDTEEEEAKAKAYLGFHEKLELHNQRLEEERARSRIQSGASNNDSSPAKSNRSAFKQFKHKTSPLHIKRTLLSKSPRHSSSTSSFSSGSRSFKALNLTRSMTGDIFDSFLRATSLRSVSPGKANL